MKFIYYERNMLGRWELRGSRDKPSSKGPEGKRRKIRQVTKLPKNLRKMDLTALANLYPLAEPVE